MKNHAVFLSFLLLVVSADCLAAPRTLTRSSVLEILRQKEKEISTFSNPWYLRLNVEVHDEAHASERVVPVWEVEFRDRLVELGILKDKTTEDWNYSRYDSYGYRYREYRGTEHKYGVLQGYPGIEGSGGQVALYMTGERFGEVLDLSGGEGAQTVTVEIIPSLTDVFWEVGSIIRSKGGLAQRWDSEVSEKWKTENPGQVPDWTSFPDLDDPPPYVAQFQFFPVGDEWEVMRLR